MWLIAVCKTYSYLHKRSHPYILSISFTFPKSSSNILYIIVDYITTNINKGMNVNQLFIIKFLLLSLQAECGRDRCQWLVRCWWHREAGREALLTGGGDGSTSCEWYYRWTDILSASPVNLIDPSECNASLWFLLYKPWKVCIWTVTICNS